MEPANILWAYLLDLSLGDPKWFVHPVKIIGSLISFLEVRLRTGRRRMALRIKGAILVLVVVGLSGLSAYFVLRFAEEINPFLGRVAWIFLAYTTLAGKDLFLHARRVLKEIRVKNIRGARMQLSHIVGRDTAGLSEEEVIKSTVESIAENTNDGVIAPLFYLMLGGPVLAIIYKAINTLDSMLGYKNERYIHFGWFAARLDDLANFLPARITGLLIVFSSWILNKRFIDLCITNWAFLRPRFCSSARRDDEGVSLSDTSRRPVLSSGYPDAADGQKMVLRSSIGNAKVNKDAFRIMLRDGRKHPSPNSGICEAAMAGALGIRLGGPYAYQGKVSLRPYLGEEKRPARASFINEALAVGFVSSVLMILPGVILKCLI